MCQEIFIILDGYFQHTELIVHIQLCMYQLTQSDTVLVDMRTDVAFAPKIYGTLIHYTVHDLCSHCHTLHVTAPD